ncbi:calcium release-activated calcium channel protein 1-like isoform X2 [Artemia franciscana]|nr:hypothetical protein QYM36_008939 [Artemia franciscana]KAK2714546.1 hypothetical protein QYM36_008939 [Artemia franciscana]KAK2714548.1 hypothetical protein QYM36_008939 [Artemia franciscana]
MEDVTTDRATIDSWKRLFLSRAKLKAASQASALLAGFAMVAMVEVNFSPAEGEQLPPGLIVSFAICTVLLVSFNMLALMISTCILPNVDAIASLNIVSFVKESPHAELRNYIELAWIASTVFGIMFFMIEIGLLCWVQFYHVLVVAAWASTVALIPITLVFIVVAVKFYQALMRHNYFLRESTVQELELLNEQWSNTSFVGPKRKPSLQIV